MNWGERRRRSRGQSELIGVVLLFGLVIMTAVTVFIVGGTAIQDATNDVNLEKAVTEMRQADSRMSRVAFGRQGGQVVIFGGTESTVQVEKGSYVEVTVNDRAACRANLTMGSITKPVEGEGTVGYEGGGVWRETGDNVTMVSPPDLRYKNGTITFPMVSMANATTGESTSLKITKNETASRQRNQEIRDTFKKPVCNPPQNMTLTVHSDYYQGWGRYLEQRLGGAVDYDHPNQTVTASVFEMGGVWGASGSSVQVDRNFTASVTVLGTELNGAGYDYGCGYNIYHTPITMAVVTDGDYNHPWPKNPDQSTSPWAIRHDINDPDKPEQYSYRFDGEAGTNVTVEATSWNGDDYECADSSVRRGGYVWNQQRPTDEDGEWISINSASQNDSNLVILTDGERLPTWAEAPWYQRNITQIIGEERIYEQNGTMRVSLEDTQALFIYELSTPNADPSNARGGGDPDYNDAVVLFELEKADETDDNFFIHVTVSQVQISEGDA